MAERNDRPWFKVMASILDSIDLDALSAEHERVFWRLQALCCRSGHGDTIRWPLERIAQRLRITKKKLTSALSALEKPGTDGQPLVEVGHAFVRIVKWNIHQPASTGAERKSAIRKTESAAAPSGGKPPRREPAARQDSGGREPAAPLDREGELEREQEEEHTQRPAVLGRMPPSAPPHGVRVAKTEAEMMPWFDAFRDGIGRQITYCSDYVIPTERLFASGKSPEQIRKAAACYASKLKDGTPKMDSFARQLDRWLAESSVAPKPPPDNPRHGAPSGAKARGWCPIHPAVGLDANGCSRCRTTQEATA